jgi:primary-amine oxidase
VHDDGVRWKSTDDYGKVQVRRGQTLLLWATLDAANYKYIIEYGFRDDGAVTLRLGATGHNLASFNQGDDANHVHIGCWRVEMDLDTPTQNKVQFLLRSAKPGKGATELPLSVDLESPRTYKADEFTRVRVISAKKNKFNQKVAYELVPLQRGAARCLGDNEQCTLSDFWVTRVGDLPKNYIDLPDYFKNPRMLTGNAVALWHSSPVHHLPRQEDFGPDGNSAQEGVAMTMWGGFELQPRNVFEQSPLYP